MLEQDAQIPETSNTTEAPEQGAPEQKPEGEGEHNEEQKHKGNGFQKRVDKLTRDKYQALGEVKSLREQLARLQQSPRQESGAESSGQDDKPMTRREAMELADQIARQRQAAQSQEATAREWKKQEAEARKRYDDYAEVVPEFVESWNPPRHVEAAILECERKVDVTYYLAKHPEEADAIALMSPFRAAAEIGKIEARLESPTLKSKSAAPEPISPLKPKGKADDGLGDDLSSDEWLKRRNAQVFKKR